MADNKLDHKLVGKNYSTADLVAKVTGRAKYAEDFRADGMLFTKLLLSPMPHARVRNIDASAALKMPGVRAILTADDMPVLSNDTPLQRGDRDGSIPLPAGRGGAGRGAGRGGAGREGAAREGAPPVDSRGVTRGNTTNEYGAAVTEEVDLKPELGLTNEPVYEGEPILAIAADDELTATEAIERIVLDLEPLPFCVDPIQSLRPDGPNARLEGNVFVGGFPKNYKWTAEDWKEVEAGRLPFRDAPDKWQYGDVEAAFREAALVIDETVVHQSTSHQALEPRSSMAYWQNGKLYLHGSTQSCQKTALAVGNWLGLPPSQLVFVAEYCGGGFGGKNPPSGIYTMAIPALLSKKTGRPVMLRISREEEHYVGRARCGLHMRAKIGFAKDGRVTAIDAFVVSDAGPYEKGGDAGSAVNTGAINYTPANMRFRGTYVLTNTPPRSSQRAPGGLQGINLFEPLIAKGARMLGVDQVAIRVLNAPMTGSTVGQPNAQGVRANHLTGAFPREALLKGAEMFKWQERIARQGQKRGSKVTGIGVALSNFGGGDIGYDGLMIIQPDGKLYVRHGHGNLGTESVFDMARVPAEMLDIPWEKVEVIYGNTSKSLPWSPRQGGSRTTHSSSRANHAAATDAIKKLQEIAAKDLGGRPEDYQVANERVSRRGGGAGMTLAHAATRAIELGGKYDGHELASDLNPMTKTSATALVGQGLMGVARDNYGRNGSTQSFVAGFAEVEVDIETGAYKVLDYLAVADVGTVIHPDSLGGQIHGAGIQGMGHILSQKWVYDEHYGVPLAKRFHYSKPPTIMDVPHDIPMVWAAVELPDPQSPVGAKGVGECPGGAGGGAIRCALAAAIGDDLLRRTPITPDMILSSIDAGKRVDRGLTTHV